MKDKIFIDTNILLYSYSNDEQIKQQKAIQVINNNIKSVIISNQVINEIINIFFRKFKLSATQITQYITEIKEIINVLDINENIQFNAIKYKEKYKLQFYDSLIIATALENNCTILYSEDMQHNQIIENQLKIINPFV